MRFLIPPFWLQLLSVCSANFSKCLTRARAIRSMQEHRISTASQRALWYI